jgi:hypothetical protein
MAHLIEIQDFNYLCKTGQITELKEMYLPIPFII